MTTTLESLYLAAARNPGEMVIRMMIADCLIESGRDIEAELWVTNRRKSYGGGGGYGGYGDGDGDDGYGDSIQVIHKGSIHVRN